jgi:hypothetical protein
VNIFETLKNLFVEVLGDERKYRGVVRCLVRLDLLGFKVSSQVLFVKQMVTRSVLVLQPRLNFF